MTKLRAERVTRARTPTHALTHFAWATHALTRAGGEKCERPHATHSLTHWRRPKDTRRGRQPRVFCGRTVYCRRGALAAAGNFIFFLPACFFSLLLFCDLRKIVHSIASVDTRRSSYCGNRDMMSVLVFFSFFASNRPDLFSSRSFRLQAGLVRRLYGSIGYLQHRIPLT